MGVNISKSAIAKRQQYQSISLTVALSSILITMITISYLLSPLDFGICPVDLVVYSALISACSATIFLYFYFTSKSKTKKIISKTNKILLWLVGSFAVLAVALTGLSAYNQNRLHDENQQLINTDYHTYYPSSSHTDINFEHTVDDKPVIYLYPTKTENVKVELNYDGKLTSTYPDYNRSINGWEVTANPDGSLINHQDGLSYSYLFWEGLPNTAFPNYDSGFVVKGSDTKTFLQTTLKNLGLTTKEYNEMIVYWLPKLENNKYNLIHFAGTEYTDTAKLTIIPTPDSILRVFMVVKPLDSFQSIPGQKLKPFVRKGFTVVEWGGTELK